MAQPRQAQRIVRDNHATLFMIQLIRFLTGECCPAEAEVVGSNPAKRATSGIERAQGIFPGPFIYEPC